MAEGYEPNIYRSLMPLGTYNVYGILAENGVSTGVYSILVELPVPFSSFSSVTCSIFRPTSQDTVKDTEPQVVHYDTDVPNVFSIATTLSNFSSYVGRKCLAQVTFS